MFTKSVTVQKHQLGEVENKVRYLLTAYFLSNVCAKNYQNLFVYVRLIA